MWEKSMFLSKRIMDLSTIDLCPNVNGEKLPGKIAIFFIG